MISAEAFNSRVATLLEHPLFSSRYLNLSFLPGWLSLIECLVATLEALPDGTSLRCSQLKVKWGRMRLHLYLDTGDLQDDLFHPADGLWVLPRPEGELDQRAEALISQAEEEAASLCHLCGQPASIRSRGMSPTCEEHSETDSKSMLEGYNTYFPGYG